MNDETREFLRRNLRHIFVAIGMAGYFFFVLWAGLAALHLTVMVFWAAVVVVLYNLVDRYLMDSEPEHPTISYQFEHRRTTANTGRNVLLTVAVALVAALDSLGSTVKLFTAGSLFLTSLWWHQRFARCLCPKCKHTVPTDQGVPDACPSCGLNLNEPSP